MRRSSETRGEVGYCKVVIGQVRHSCCSIASRILTAANPSCPREIEQTGRIVLIHLLGP
jgi:hypothetical protein